jgi:hypothetical protein
MSDEKGLLLKQQENEIAEFLEKKVKFKSPVLEAFDKPVFKAIISLVDDYGLDKLPEEYQEDGSKLATALLDKDYESAAIYVWKLGSKIVEEFIKKEE